MLTPTHEEMMVKRYEDLENKMKVHAQSMKVHAQSMKVHVKKMTANAKERAEHWVAHEAKMAEHDAKMAEHEAMMVASAKDRAEHWAAHDAKMAEHDAKMDASAKEADRRLETNMTGKLVRDHLAEKMDMSDETCAICIGSNCNLRLTGCGHHYHTMCISKWIFKQKKAFSVSTCPVCRCFIF